MFPAISADNDEPVTEVESLCMRCMKNGTTRLLPTKIPHFKQIIISSFDCAECGFSNREIMPAAEIAEMGVRYELKVESKANLDREVIRSLTARISISALDFSFEPGQSSLSTVEGFLSQAIENLESTQESLRQQDPENAVKLAIFVAKLRRLVMLEEGAFTFLLDDPAGNSFIASTLLLPGQVDSNLTVRNYQRTAAQDEELGISAAPAAAGEASAEAPPNADMIQFNSICPKCDKPNCEANMKQIDVPNFGEVVVMATYCPSCGFREAEARPGGGIAPLARKITLKVATVEDLKRMVVKSATARVEVPEVQLELTSGTLGGRITTVEGLLRAVIDDLEGVVVGDSVARDRQAKITDFVKRLDDLATGRELNFHLVLDDPAGKIFIESIREGDVDLQTEDYDRTFEQNDELGLNDMVVEGYEPEHQQRPPENDEEQRQNGGAA